MVNGNALLWMATFLCVVISLPAFSGGVRAEPVAEASSPDAHDWFRRGLEQSRAGEWEDARSAFLESVKREPRVSTYFNLAVVSIKLGMGQSALEALDEFMRRADPQEHSEFLTRALTLRSEALSSVAKLQVMLKPQDARVRLDERELPSRAGALRTFDVDPGAHKVQIEAPGYEALSVGIELAAGETQRLTLVLAPSPEPVVDRLSVKSTAQAALSLPTAQPARAADLRAVRRRWLWGGLAAAAAGALVTAVVIATRPTDHRRTSAPEGYCGSTNICF